MLRLENLRRSFCSRFSWRSAHDDCEIGVLAAGAPMFLNCKFIFVRNVGSSGEKKAHIRCRCPRDGTFRPLVSAFLSNVGGNTGWWHSVPYAVCISQNSFAICCRHLLPRPGGKVGQYFAEICVSRLHVAPYSPPEFNNSL